MSTLAYNHAYRALSVLFLRAVTVVPPVTLCLDARHRRFSEPQRSNSANECSLTMHISIAIPKDVKGFGLTRSSIASTSKSFRKGFTTINRTTPGTSCVGELDYYMPLVADSAEHGFISATPASAEILLGMPSLLDLLALPRMFVKNDNIWVLNFLLVIWISWPQFLPPLELRSSPAVSEV